MKFIRLRLSTVAVAVAGAVVMTAAAPPDVPLDALLLQPMDLLYGGAFRVPRGTFGSAVVGGQGVATFSYGGTAVAFNPARRSLFMVGHDWGQLVAEVTVPEFRRGTEPGDLPTAQVVQRFTDITEGRMSRVGPNTVKVGGLLAYGGRLLATAYVYYDGDGAQRLSHFVSGVDLSVRGDVEGPYQVGAVGAGFVSGYLAEVPPEWREALGGPVLTGNCCLSVPARTSFGPALFVMDPDAFAGVSAAPATPLVYYPSAHPLAAWDATSPLFNGATEITRVVFPSGTRSVLFFGRRGIGPFCYGPGTADRTQVGKPADGGVDRFCYDPVLSSKGSHAYPYEYAVWAYDAVDLLAVKDRARAPWDVRPYATWKLALPMASENARLLGAAYDNELRRLFVVQAYGETDLPIVHSYYLPTSGPLNRRTPSR